MKRFVILAWMVMFCIVNLNGCGNEKNDKVETEKIILESEKILGESIEYVQLFPRSDSGFVGDPMPYYEDGIFHVFFLNDLRDGKRGYHPWALCETSNFIEYEHKGIVIPYGDSVENQDAALGTGSVIKDADGLYHAYFTGHNDMYSPKEAIMHATSQDLINWIKHPEDTFYAGDKYAKDDFRDPYVLYVEEESQYWMLVTTRYEEQGVLVKYTSNDLKNWKEEGIFFTNDMRSNTNLECPSLLEYKGKWYLTFSDQWPDRQFHYRISDSINGPFEIPKQDVLDGNGFYAGRLESDGDNLYAFGWNGTKNQHLDSEEYGWGGNLVVHQLVQCSDGTLVPVLNTFVKEKMKQELSLEPRRITETIQVADGGYIFKGEKYEVVEFDELVGSYLFECTIKNVQDSERFGFTFNTDANAVGALNIVFNPEEQKLEFYNTKEIYGKEPQSEISLDFGKKEQLNISMLIADNIVSVYVDEHCAFTTRMYASQRTNWGIFGINASIQYENVKIYK